jgi:hypothetical protein
VFTGPTSSQCVLEFDTVAADLNNYGAIAARYNALNRPTSGKLNTPAVQALPMVKTMLQGDMSPGKKYVLFVTDSETDYCDDGNPLCPLDSVTYLIEDLYAAGIGTFVLGLPSDQSQYAMNALQGFANAGAGLPAPPPMQTGIYDQCQGTAGWRTIWTAAGRTGNVPTATYQAGAMNAPLFTPDPNNRTALANAIASVIQGVKSCTFDLDEFKINLARLNEASVMIEGAAVPLDATKTNGWYMNSATQLELYGQTCADWRNPDVDDIRFDFPCDIIVD